MSGVPWAAAVASHLLLAVAGDLPQGIGEFPGDAFNSGFLVRVGPVGPGELQTVGLGRAQDLQQMRVVIGWVVVLA
jgi:hypothetical protein